MAILQQKDREAVQRRLDAEMVNEVTLTLYTQANLGIYVPGRECQYCGPAEQLLDELAGLSTKLALKKVDVHKSTQGVRDSGIERIPAIVIGRGDSENARFYGMPMGLEFASFLDSIISASREQTALKADTKEKLAALEGLDEYVHIRVFVTPTCGYCPGMVRMAHNMAFESGKVLADVIEVQEFPELAQHYDVRSVPKTVINDSIELLGMVPEEMLVKGIYHAIGIDVFEDEGEEQQAGEDAAETPQTTTAI
ncbi:MAG: glutaredoxin [SAR202 cluster bacterium]|nr:glutaredoxin [SAR202 cluster bacterium]